MLYCNNISKFDARQFFLFGARMTFGPWLFYVGLIKWINGPAAFIEAISSQFAAAWIPAILVTISAWIILIAEPLIGAWLVTGKFQRYAWISATKLMFLLLLGQTVLGNPQVIGNWQYVIFCLIAASFSCGTSDCSDSQCAS